MKGLRKYGSSGETLVEVMVCAVLFLLLAAVMQAAVSFSTNALRKSAQIREENAEICAGLRESGTVTRGTLGSYDFQAATGSKKFTIRAYRSTKSVSYEDSQGNTRTAEFYLYEAGGGAP